MWKVAQPAGSAADDYGKILRNFVDGLSKRLSVLWVCHNDPESSFPFWALRDFGINRCQNIRQVSDTQDAISCCIGVALYSACD